MIGMILFGGLYGWGVTATVDILIDRSTPARYTTVVEDKHRSTQRGTATYLVLRPWGPLKGHESNLAGLRVKTYVFTNVRP